MSQFQELGYKRICKEHQETEDHGDHRDRIEQSGHDEHPNGQHGRELWLTGHSFQKSASQNPETDAGSDGSQTEHESSGNG
jgi:hypothetical protein